MNTKANQYNPQTVSHPGVTLGEKLAELGLGSKEFSVRTGKPEKTISGVINGTSSLTSDMAVLFEDVLRIPAKFWLERQNRYDEALARIKRAQAMEKEIPWVKNFPYAAMAKLGWIPSTRSLQEKLKNLHTYFSVGSASAFDAYYFEQKVQASFRISLSKTKKPYAFAAWLRQGGLQARKLPNIEYNKAKLTEALPLLKKVMAKHPDNFFKQIQDICLQAGVKVVYTPCLPGAAVHGSTRWIGDMPIIQMSARYKQNDIFWFTFFHEVAHILKHGKKFVALEHVDYDEEDQLKEVEADEFAVKWTFSIEEEDELLAKKRINVDDIIKYANKFGTHPAMIIGRFHHKKILHYSKGREFIKSIDLSMHHE